MKRLIPTLVLLIICIGGFWYARSNDFFREKKNDVKTLVTAVKADELQAVSLQSADGKQMELQRNAGKLWTMSKPAALPVDSSLVDGWVQSYNLLSYEAKVEDNADLAKYGLDKPQQLYKLTMQNGPVHTIRVGMPLAIQGYSYVSVDDGKTVYQVGDQALSGIAKAPVDFQAKSPVTLDYDKVTALSVAWKDQRWSLTKTDTGKSAADAAWKVGGKELKGSDASSVLGALLFLQTQQEARPAAALNMNVPDFSADLTETDGGTAKTTKYVGRIDSDNVWLMKQGDVWAYAVPLKSVQDLADKGKQ